MISLGERSGNKADAEEMQHIKKKKTEKKKKRERKLRNSPGTSQNRHSQAYVTQRLYSVGKRLHCYLKFTNF